ncbi:MAG: hypothetical protein J6M25_02450 [Prevotella sp.]|nr:hypothetical protein [Prevotella sp.]
MKQIKTLGWLVVAAALTTTFAACSNDDNDTPDTPAAPAKSITITVGAGITDDNATRSAITTEGTSRTLTFTTGDKLFVRASYGTAANDDSDCYEHVLSGYLTMVGSPSADGKRASFTGDLEQWDRGDKDAEGNYTYTKAASITVSVGDDPLSAEVTYATLVHKNAVKDTDYDDEDWRILFKYDVLASDVNTLMTKNLEIVTTVYDSKSFKFNESISPTLPILNCTISGLTNNATYNVTYTYANSITGVKVDSYSLTSTVTANENGTATFAFFGMYQEGENYSHTLTFENINDNSDTKTVTIGTRDLSSYKTKVLNVTRTAN